MKRIFISLFAAVLAVSLSAQAPQSFKYQTVVRSADGSTVLASQTVAFRISILQGTITGTESYVETFSVATNQFGLAVSNIGEGTPVTGTFSTIDWGTGPYFMKVEIDPDNGTDFEEVGTSQLLSVPYALHAKTTDDAFSGDYKDLANVPTAVKSDTMYMVRLMAADEDYINFGTFANFTNSSDWSIIERIMMPAGSGTEGGWHFFRGKAWGDKEGDIAISISTSGLHAWVQKSGWKSVTYSTPLAELTWYNICFQYDAGTNTLELYLDGVLVNQLTGVSQQDDSGNTNKMFWGGQDVAPGAHGALYSETSIVFASQHWLQRKLTPAEISAYDGTFNSEPALFFSAKINPSFVTDATGNGRDGTNGNTPEYLSEVIIQGSEINEPVFISGVSNYGEIDSDITVTGTALFMNSDGKYEKADAGSALTMPCVALALETGTGNKKILLQGYVSNDDWSWTPGGLIYVSPDDAGTLTQTIPASSGNQVQIVGYASKPNTVYFNPNLMLIEIK